MALGQKSSRGPLTDLRRVSARLNELAEEYGLRVDPKAVVWQLAVGEGQRVEILKALYRDDSLLVLDEPTAVLTPKEVDDLFVVLRRLAAEPRPPRSAAGEAAMVVKGLVVPGDRGDVAVRGVDLEVRAGEIVGIAGVSGNGQRELAEAIAGLRRPSAGSISVGGSELVTGHPAEARAAGLSYVPEGRMRDGVVPEFAVEENLLLTESDTSAYSRFGFLRRGVIRQHCTEVVSGFTVRTPGLDTPVRNLSGGNIQKLIMARELSGEPKVLLVAQPTRGIDVGASQYIHLRLRAQREAGTAVLIISEDLDEVMSVSDRVVVMYEGRIAGSADPSASTREAIGLLMAGVSGGGDGDERP